MFVRQERASGVSLSILGVDSHIIYESLTAAGQWRIYSSPCAFKSRLLLGENGGLEMCVSSICEFISQRGPRAATLAVTAGVAEE